MAKETTEKKLYDLLTTRDYDNFQALDSRTGKVPVNPETGAQDVSRADMFTFDWSSSRGKNYGTAVILLTPEHELELYFGDNLGKTMEDPDDKDEWFEFMEQLRHFATRTNFNGFRPLNINQLRHSLQGQAAIKEGLFESWQGRKNMSWSAGPTEARLMIRHKRNLDEGDARHLYIESLFIETAEGERYKLPFAKLAGGRAMLEHVRRGGKPYDIRGQHIVDIVQELNVLGRFERGVARETVLEGDTAQLVSEAAVYRKTLKENLKRLGTGRGYAEYFESWNPVDLTEQDVVIESLKHMFVKQTLDARIEQALPVLARIQQQGNAMKEATIFEAWANRLVEGTWSTPDTPEAQQKLLDFMSREQPVGADATDATEQLYDLLGDDKLFDQLATLAESDPNADCRQMVLDRMQQLSDNPDVRAVLEQLNIDADATMTPPESLPADLDDQEQDMSESEESWHGITDPELLQDMIADAGSMDYDEFYDEYSSMLDDPEEFWSEYHVARSKKRPLKDLTTSISPEEYAAKYPDSPGLKFMNRTDLEEAMFPGSAIGDKLRGMKQSIGRNAGTALKVGMAAMPGAGAGASAGSAMGAATLGSAAGSASAVFAPALAAGALGGAAAALGGFLTYKGLNWLAQKLFGTKEEALAFASAHLKAAGAGQPQFEFQGKTYPVKVKSPEEAQQLLYKIRTLQSQLDEDTAIDSLRRAAGLTENVLRDSTGSTFDHILDTFKRDVRDFEESGDMSDALYDALYDYYHHDMPYGVQKARTGDPYEWVSDRFGSDLGIGGYGGNSPGIPDSDYGMERESAGDYAPERDPHSVDGGMDNELLYDDDEEKNSSVMPALAGSAAGGAAGYALGSGALNSIGSSVPSAPIAPPVMVEKDMDRMKELAGVKTTDEALTMTGLAGNMTADSVATGTNDAAFTAGKVAGIPKAAVDSFKSGYKDTTTTTDEGWKGQLAGGTVGTLAGAAAGGALGPLGAAIGGAAGGTAGQMIGDKLGGKEETDESPLKGQYGHSGKMQAVDKDTSFLDRLKELSGMSKS
jgi:hypothetical protein